MSAGTHCKISTHFVSNKFPELAFIYTTEWPKSGSDSVERSNAEFKLQSASDGD
jgi:hypothetical protein